VGWDSGDDALHAPGVEPYGRMTAAPARGERGEGAPMKDKQTYSFELEPAKVAFLEEMTRTHGLADVGKALRCLIDYAREHPQAQEAIFAEIHCVDCGS
jgi:hypothetical protein